MVGGSFAGFDVNSILQSQSDPPPWDKVCYAGCEKLENQSIVPVYCSFHCASYIVELW